MYATRLPSGHFNPTIHPVAQLPTPPSPPASLRTIVDRLNKTPTRVRSTRSTANLKSCSTPSLFDNHSNTGAATNGPQQHSSSSSTDTTTISTTPATPNNNPLSQAIIRALDTTPLKTALPPHFIPHGRLEVQVQIHIHQRPIAQIFPQREQLKRKRDSSEDEIMGDSCEMPDRQVKKIKLSHGFGMAGVGPGQAQGMRRGGRGRGRGKNEQGRREVGGMRRSLRSGVGREMGLGGRWGRGRVVVGDGGVD